MKCKDCSCCHLTSYTRWDSQIRCFREVSVYECWGVKEPFEITDVNCECTEYPEKRTQDNEEKCFFRIGTEECGIDITPNGLIFITNGKRIAAEEVLKNLNTNICPYCGREIKNDKG